MQSLNKKYTGGVRSRDRIRVVNGVRDRDKVRDSDKVRVRGLTMVRAEG